MRHTCTILLACASGVAVVSAAPASELYDASMAISARGKKDGKGAYKPLSDGPATSTSTSQGHSIPAIPYIDPNPAAGPPAPLPVTPASSSKSNSKVKTAVSTVVKKLTPGSGKKRREFDDTLSGRSSDEVLALRDIIEALSSREIDDLE